jgi:DNA polymerase III delta prime subunit
MQGSFRRVMEDYSARGNCVFILICNYERKVIKPIKSRCAIFEFKKVQIEDLVDRGKFILMKEKIIFKEEDILQLARDSEGKPRNFIMSLQKYSLDGELKVEKEASLDMHTKRLLTAIFKAEERDLERALEIYNEITRTISDNPREIVLDIHNMIVENKKMNRDLKGRVLKIISDVDFRISQDTNPYIQMTGLIVNLFILSTSFIQEMQKQNQK